MKKLSCRPIIYAIALTLTGCATVKNDPNIVFHCTFDDTDSILSPAVGHAGTVNDATFVDGKNGKALYVPAYAATATFPFPNGIPSSSGTIDFWAKLEGGREHYSSGVDPYLFIVTKEGSNGWPVVFECNFNANNGCGASGFFCGMSFGRAVNISGDGNRYASILGKEDTFGWHRYTIEWDRTGLSSDGCIMRVSIDGKVVGKGIKSKKDIEDFCNGISCPVNLVFSNPKSGHGHSAIAIDDFTISSSVRK